MVNYGLEALVVLSALFSMIKFAKKGFIACLFGLISTAVALVAAILLAKTVVEITDGVFGLEKTLFEKFHKAFIDVEGFNVDISSVGVKDALKELDAPEAFTSVIIKLIGDDNDHLPYGTTLAKLVGEALASLAVMLVAGLIIFIIVKLIMRLFRKGLTALAEKVSFIRSTNGFLGGVFGLVRSLFHICLILALLTLFPDDSIAEYLSEGLFLGKLYANNPLVTLLGKII
jgi:uncharacterized membrane protein required for colicin V production